MRVGINGLFLKAGRVAGIETYLRGMIAGLASLPEDSDSYFIFVAESYADSFQTGPNIKVVPCPISGNSRIQRLVWEQLIFPSYLRRFGIELLHSPGYLGPIFLRIPSVVTVLDLNYIFAAASFPWYERALRHLMISTSARATDAVITISEFSKHDIVERLHIPPERIWVTYLSTRIQPDPDGIVDFHALSERHNITSPYLLSVASSHPHKNLVTLIESFLHLYQEGVCQKYQLVLVGHKMGQHNSLLEFSRQSIAKEAIKFVGFVSDEDLAVLYSHADMFVFPSLYEGFGIPVLEAMTMGVPVVSSDAASLPEVVGNAAITVDARSPKLLAEAIRQVLVDPVLARRLVDDGRTNAKRFTWQRTARMTRNVYEAVLKQQKERKGIL